MGKQIFHYTSADAFVSMVNTGGGIHGELTFWASSVYYMNDTSEMTVLYDELIKILPKIEKELNLADNLLSEIQSNFFLNNGLTIGGVVKDFFISVFLEMFM